MQVVSAGHSISNEALGKLIVDNLPQSAWVKNNELIYTGYNNLLTQRFGARITSQMLDHCDYDLPWENYAANYQAADKEVLSINSAMEYIHLIRLEHDSEMIISSKKTILKNAAGESFGVLGIVNILWPTAFDAFRVIIELDESLVGQSAHYNNQYILYNNTIPDENLTNKEILCLFYLLRSCTMKEIGKLLLISSRTVETHIENIKFKFKCSTKSDLIDKAIAKNLLRFIPRDLKIHDFLVVKSSNSSKKSSLF